MRFRKKDAEFLSERLLPTVNQYFLHKQQKNLLAGLGRSKDSPDCDSIQVPLVCRPPG